MSLRSDMNGTGVYLITNVVTGKVYVGSAAGSFAARWNGHRSQLRRNRHSNKRFQNAWNAYGESSFTFQVLERCPPEDCICREQWHIDNRKAATREHGYNIAPVAGSLLGMRHSDESKAKISRALQGKKPSPESVAKRSATLTGHVVSDETRRKISTKARARRASPETRARMSEAHKRQSPETRAKISAAGRLRVQSPEARAKIAEANRKRWKSSEARQTQSLKVSLGKRMRKTTKGQLWLNMN